ncbi:hypothetical protein MKK50_18005 [Methylobacterium sp. J-043]|nr:hypothetical protein [Methylobacterium sp. J-043]
MRLTLITDNGKAVTRLSKVRRAAARPDMEIARLRRCIAAIKKEAERAQARAAEAEKLWEAVLRAAFDGDPTVTAAMVRHAMIEGANAHRCALVARYCEMAEEGTLCG